MESWMEISLGRSPRFCYDVGVGEKENWRLRPRR
jgi:hypothetical protein